MLTSNANEFKELMRSQVDVKKDGSSMGIASRPVHEKYKHQRCNRHEHQLTVKVGLDNAVQGENVDIECKRIQGVDELPGLRK